MQVMTVKELSGYLRCHPSTIYRAVAKGKIPFFKVGSDYRFHMDAISQWQKPRVAKPLSKAKATERINLNEQ